VHFGSTLAEGTPTPAEGVTAAVATARMPIGSSTIVETERLMAARRRRAEHRFVHSWT
jgi:hypothetical protein